MNLLRWNLALAKMLSRNDAVRIITTPQIDRIAASLNPGISPRTVARWIRDAVATERLVPVVRGLFLNHFAAPAVRLAEAACYLRPGAVVSLQSVLEECGVINCPAPVVTAVIALVPGLPPPKLGGQMTRAGRFHFRGVPSKVLIAGRQDDRLEPGSYPCATPEKALVDWLYLARSPRSDLPLPPLEIDLDALDRKRLRRLARTSGLSDTLETWIARKQMHDRHETGGQFRSGTRRNKRI